MKASTPSMRVNIQLMQRGQKRWSSGSSPIPPRTVVPRMTANPSGGTMAVMEKALALIY